MHFAQTLLTLCTAASAVLGAPTPSKLETRQTTFNGKSLSILPLGDSITVSTASIGPTTTHRKKKKIVKQSPKLTTNNK